MQCSEIEHLLYLHRDGELTREEEISVSGHLKTCSRCRELYQELNQLDSLFEVLRDEQPTAINAEQLPAKITASLPVKADPGTIFFPHWMTERFIRMTLAALIGVLITIFVTEQYISLDKIASLESKMAEQSTRQSVIESPWNKLESFSSEILGERFNISEITVYQNIFDEIRSGKVRIANNMFRFSIGKPLFGQERIEHLFHWSPIGKSGKELLKKTYRYSVQEGAQ